VDRIAKLALLSSVFDCYGFAVGLTDGGDMTGAAGDRVHSTKLLSYLRQYYRDEKARRKAG
jgi:hypothetical protein